MPKSKHSRDIDHVLKHWEFDTGAISVRLVPASDGRDVLQMRIDLGVLQLEVENRPDGWRPGGAETYLDYLMALAIHEGEGFELSEEQCAEVEREFMQFYHRRICWLALREYHHAVKDADHNLALMDFVRTCSPSDDWTESHEQYRPFILFHRTQAAALAALEDAQPEVAIEEVNRGLEAMRDCYPPDGEGFESAADESGEVFEDDEMISRLVSLRETLREQYHVGQTLTEQLAEAVAAEQYEQAARLRDEIARQHGRKLPS